jgi:hypothetical protein
LFDYSIVAVHGLNGHREKTWTAGGKNWLREFLPFDIPNARILSWGYDANTHSTSPISTQSLYDHAKTLISDLCLKRRLTEVLELWMKINPLIYERRRLRPALSFSSLTAWEE